VRAADEFEIYQNQHELELKPEERIKYIIGSDGGVNAQPLNENECRQNLASEIEKQLLFSMAENALRTATVAKTTHSIYQLYQRLSALHQPPIAALAPVIPPPPAPAPALGAIEDEVEEDPFDLLKLDHIPPDLYRNMTLSRFVCGITEKPIRHPVQDPTVRDEHGKCVSLFYERKMLIKWLVNNRYQSPETRQIVYPHQLITPAGMKFTIDDTLRKISEEMRCYHRLETIEADPVLLNAALAEIAHLQDEEKS
jgi:hypothetical protein